jgi:cytochrome P450
MGAGMSERTVTESAGLQLFPFPTPPARDDEPEVARLRTDEPVAKVRLASGHEAWLITRYEDCRTVMADPRFSRALTARPDAPSLTPAIQSPNMLTSMDPPAHTRVRKLINKAFTYRAIERARPRITEIVDGLLDGMAGQDPPVDLAPCLAEPLPRTVICELLGMPRGQREPLDRFMEYFGPDTEPPPAAVVTGAMAFLGEMIELKRRHPGDDLLSALVAAHEGTDRLTQDELLMTTLLLFAAGQDTTRNQLCNSLVTLFRHPDQLALLRERPELLPAAIEELLRYTRITQAGLVRIATADVDVAGVTVRAGEAVIPLAHSANRDAAVFDRPDELDLTRPDAGAHMAFGHGTHFCVGSALARLELQIAMGRLLARFPTLAPAAPLEELTWAPGQVLRTITALPVTW